MLLNHARKTPWDWDDAIPSLCPDCGAQLIPRRGRVLIWHWAHRASRSGAAPSGCGHRETFWHLAWKSVYRQFPGWDIEVRCRVGGQLFRLDAANLGGGKVREFVHSLSESYIQKHLALAGAGLDVLWIFDGAAFVAERSKPIRRGGRKHLLKPKARWLHGKVGGLVHHDGLLWKEWKSDCWYPVESDRAGRLLAAYERFMGELSIDRPALSVG